MLASLQGKSAQSDTLTVNVSVTYDPTQEPGLQFTLGTDPSFASNNVIQTDGDTLVQVTLAGPTGTTVQFNASTAVNFTPPSMIAETLPKVDVLGPQQISFTIPKPDHFFAPWSFQLSIDAQTADGTSLLGVDSPSIFVSLAPNPGPNVHDIDLTYDPTSGDFVIADCVTLGHTQLLVNTVAPLTLNVNLSGASFPSAPSAPAIFFGLVPDWMDNPPTVTPTNNQQLSLAIGSNAPGNNASFLFVVNAGGVLVPSPDPILVNATLGDG
jgi:hypothetical protein